MENATYIALSRLDTEMRAMSVVANNLANASTTGYKAEHSLFSDYIVKQTALNHPRGGETEAYTQDIATYRDMSQGSLQQTGNPLDLALGADGYFSVQTRNGVRLTRAGRFERMSDGTIADEAGNPLLDRTGQPIRLQPSDQTITISGDGTISTENGVAGYIGVVTAQDQNSLLAEGNRLFVARSATRQTPNASIAQGMLEGSTVQSMTEMTHMMEIERDFSLVSQFLDGESTRQQNAIDKITQVQS